jgi:signal peptidase I
MIEKWKEFFRWKYSVIYVAVTLIILVAFLVLPSLIKSTLFEAFSIPTISMENTLLSGDYIIVNKTSFGIHLPYSSKYLFKYNSPKNGDVVLYFQTEFNSLKVSEEIAYAKRVTGSPGDTIHFKNKVLYINKKVFPDPVTIKFMGQVIPEGVAHPKIFPKGYSWNDCNYGPLYVPKEGDVAKIDSSNFWVWEGIVTAEGHSIELKSDGKIYLDNNPLTDGLYKIKQNYYFVTGDNRDYSLDSRYNGFVPENKIIGKADRVYWSRDTKLNIRWDRIGYKIK